ncbi:MAG: DUF2279 domain-containing protein [Bacteroidetes bacterium HGW-Bacteroidetes-1]|jgi:hypothetical protein|nr:MAG: DUF2279 domain-containing protein [Bacteroidetes bacterium HGW-Bacteroidetes-1]
MKQIIKPISFFQLICIFILLSLDLHVSNGKLFAQTNMSVKLNDNPAWLIPADSLNTKRLGIFVGSTTVAYSATMYGLNNLWYSNFPRNSFHWINDLNEWQQVDKMGHLITPYLEARYVMQMLEWTGVERRKAAIYAGITAFMFQNSIEIFDGFSKEWGASASDIGANFLGSALMTTQELVWGEQRMMLKIMPSFVHYHDIELQRRSEELFGTGLIVRTIKDYNSLNAWLSINPASFNKSQKRFRWLNIAVGYGAGGMFGGYENIWTDSEGVFHDRTDVVRYRKLMLSLDVDFSKIPVKSRYARALLDLLNIIKIPAPTIEFNSKGQVIFHPIL